MSIVPFKGPRTVRGAARAGSLFILVGKLPPEASFRSRPQGGGGRIAPPRTPSPGSARRGPDDRSAP
jgi:hypothetical protein